MRQLEGDVPEKNRSSAKPHVLIEDEWFKDEQGRSLILKGINLVSKVPLNLDGCIDLKEQHLQREEISFVGRPFPLHEADEHFIRLKYWGFNLIRLLVPWEAIEHKGPGRYDEAYLDYLEKLVAKAGENDLHVFIDFHQDMFSRILGGCGAPSWVIEKVGFDFDHLEETGAAVFHDAAYNGPLSHILWATNESKLGTATMFTLFFGGDLFAPKKRIEGYRAQQYLQTHYICAVLEVVQRLQGFSHVLGYDVMNEPLTGFIGCKDIRKPFGHFQLGLMPTPFEAMVLGEGHPCKIDLWKKKFFTLRKVGRKIVNGEAVRVWRSGFNCPWQEEGVWGYVNHMPMPLKPDHFCKISGKSVDFNRHCYKPFLLKISKAIHKVQPKTFIFIENATGQPPPEIEKHEIVSRVFSGHWYDAYVLALRHFLSFLAVDLFKKTHVIHLPRFIRRALAMQIKWFIDQARKKMGKIPVLISEFGIPFDLSNKKKSPKKLAKLQTKALNRSYTALEDNLISHVQWNFLSSNSNEHGDHWNREDFSIYSLDHTDNPLDPYAGLRAKSSLIRPYAKKIAGHPLYMHFDQNRGVFEFVFESHLDPHVPSEFHIPDYHYGNGFEILLSDGEYQMNSDTQTLLYYHTSERTVHCLHIAKKR